MIHKYCIIFEKRDAKELESVLGTWKDGYQQRHVSLELFFRPLSLDVSQFCFFFVHNENQFSDKILYYTTNFSKMIGSRSAEVCARFWQDFKAMKLTKRPRQKKSYSMRTFFCVKKNYGVVY